MDKVKIYTSTKHIEIMDAKNILAEAGIKYFEINKMDTAHAGILGGSIELHVATGDAEEAINALADLK
ncbi:DUF2007 domain-containing protein [uncultured Kordia sp.]|uniref:putative signal transducing protein n=1 Tax=uncultured Kordia sp. TaxID=507699 RepID=UPI00261C9B66|nr:DUF2007 domain-containing protein [uncultured Kordia sp.]